MKRQEDENCRQNMSKEKKQLPVTDLNRQAVDALQKMPYFFIIYLFLATSFYLKDKLKDKKASVEKPGIECALVFAENKEWGTRYT